jgi:hypothetical protein
MHPAVLLERTVVGIVHAHLVPDRAQDRLLGEGVGTELEGDLVHQDSPVPATCLKVLELAFHDCVVVRDQVVDITGQRQYDSGTVLAPWRVERSRAAEEGRQRAAQISLPPPPHCTHGICRLAASAHRPPNGQI